MAKILLDYVFPISVIIPPPQASTAFLKQVLVVAKPKAGQEGNVGKIFPCTTMAQVLELTDNENSQQLFNAGMTRVLVLLANDLNLASILDAHKGEFFTVLISDDFSDVDVSSGTVVVQPEVKASAKIQDILYTAKLEGALGDTISIEYTSGGTAGSEQVSVTNDTEISVQIEDGVSTAQQIATAIANHAEASALVEVEVDQGDEADPQFVTGPTNLEGGVDEVTESGTGLALGTFEGVTGVSSDNDAFLEAQAAINNRVAFKTKTENGADSMFYAFGSLLSNQLNWLNQQYIEMPYDEGIGLLGDAENLFDKKISFVLNDDEFGNRLALFAAGGKAIVAPYILKNLRIDIQSRTLQWIAANQPDYTMKEAALLENRLQEDVINNYINERRWISGGTIKITLREQNFVASGEIEVPEPKAMWRVAGEMRQTV